MNMKQVFLESMVTHCSSRMTMHHLRNKQRSSDGYANTVHSALFLLPFSAPKSCMPNVMLKCLFKNLVKWMRLSPAFIQISQTV